MICCLITFDIFAIAALLPFRFSDYHDVIFDVIFLFLSFLRRFLLDS